MPTLVSISYSPWSIRTRLALDAMGIAHARRAYTPVLSEPRLRLGLRRLTGRVTLPVMFLDDGTVLEDSLDIVSWASRQAARPLIAPGAEDAVRQWNDLAELLLSAGRIRTTQRVQQSPAALAASLPAPIRLLGPLGMAIGRKATADLLVKYPAEASLDAMATALDRLHTALTRGEDRPVAPTDHLLGATLTYADLTCAVGLSFVQPHAKHPLEDAARACWTEPTLATPHADLLAWRDAIMAQTRALRPGSKQP